LLRLGGIKLGLHVRSTFQASGVRFSAQTTILSFIFLDEATAFSAGHRPCTDCRRARYNEFKSAWCAANPSLAGNTNPPFGHIDKPCRVRTAYLNGCLTLEKARDTHPTRLLDGVSILFMAHKLLYIPILLAFQSKY